MRRREVSSGEHAVTDGVGPGLIPQERSEPEIVPFAASSPQGERVIVFAPHPDDETLGCGGTLKMLSALGKTVKVVFLTKGEKARPDIADRESYAKTREREAIKAMRILGVPAYEFLRFPDRELFQHREKVDRACRKIVGDFGPDAVYGPSPVEINPDHRATAELLLDLHGESTSLRCLFYEVVTPFRPNILVDVTSTYKYKEKAVKCYKSQLKITDYLRISKALNTYRSLTLPEDTKYAEAFWEVEKKISKREMELWLSYESPVAKCQQSC
jgi:LmbE family N-acetylglucosaminyl deacetylase